MVGALDGYIAEHPEIISPVMSFGIQPEHTRTNEELMEHRATAVQQQQNDEHACIHRDLAAITFNTFRSG